MSGNESRFARALANEPNVLLVDEPTGNLDSEAVDRVLALLRRIRAERHTTIVLVTHDPAVAAADRLFHLRDGRVDVSPTVP